ncbi:uncharacterized protein LOC124797824 [Schistocerca piceifrons]|uniref:uncharacterized protein LOC124797824 n=1 Tax=Schistocerca piceifrons TaxID=274613 RepID=UPI001F5E9579|nr:uncharacterized protein LOC124797824 [Schistocerca piceifrons]
MHTRKSVSLLLLLVAVESFTALPISDSETSTVEEEVSSSADTVDKATGKVGVDSEDATPVPATLPVEDISNPSPTEGSDDSPVAVDDSTEDGSAGASVDAAATVFSSATVDDKGTTAETPETTQLDTASEVVVIEVVEDILEEETKPPSDMEGAETMIFRPMFAYYPGEFQ